ncbi:hypothetical protein chiPu_0009899 [Chiloscyllium punctatum]|uniref:Type I cytokine receptor cytokine-binding domain-containing protein n=1 Tax=Chiloscyllium punctatum TaxID=137246 RepID=A0A401SM41_CHIPU|nr:hypothetical protein [Chiloscyllium punctatum]
MVPPITCFAISFVLPILLSDGYMDFLANLTDLNPPTNLTIVDRQLGEVTISWNDGLSEIIKQHSCIRYPFEYKYFDSHTWQEDSRLLQPEYMKRFELHRGVYIRVKNVLLDEHKRTIKESNWTVMDIQPPPGDQETLAFNFSCVLYNHSTMNCTWNSGRQAANDTQYKMYYRQNDVTLQCTHYMDVGGKKGCHIDPGTVDVEENILICVNGSNSSRTIQQYYTEFDPQEYEVYNPPVNLEVLPNLTVKWDMPPAYDINIHCFAFELNVTDLDQEPVQSFNVYWMLIILAVLVMVVGLIVMLAFKSYSMLELVLKPIPCPQKKFKSLFDEYNGDFQNWMNCQVPVSKVDECLPVVIEESPQTEELGSFHCRQSMHLP